jgi:hypothetical protein
MLSTPERRSQQSQLHNPGLRGLFADPDGHIWTVTLAKLPA